MTNWLMTLWNRIYKVPWFGYIFIRLNGSSSAIWRAISCLIVGISIRASYSNCYKSINPRIVILHLFNRIIMLCFLIKKYPWYFLKLNGPIGPKINAVLAVEVPILSKNEIVFTKIKILLIAKLLWVKRVEIGMRTS